MIGTLWSAQVACFAVGWFGPWRDASSLGTNGRLPRPVRMVLSASLVLAALLIWNTSSAHAAVYSGWVLLGMSASFLGDLIMAKLIALPNRLIGGMIAFAGAHALYIAAYAETAGAAGATLPNPGLWCGLFVYGAATLAGWWFVIRNPQKTPLLNAGALVYGAWISVMASFALALATALGGAWWLAALGGLAFVASDFLIGVTEIRGARIRNANDWIWLTYVGGQMGIIYAAAL
jgi:hypothetical protein